MRALYGSERQAEALNAFQAMRERLRDELGVDPGKELHRVHEAGLRRDDAHLLGRKPAGKPVRDPARRVHGGGPRRRGTRTVPAGAGRAGRRGAPGGAGTGARGSR
ncbi:BTAD domain-containing putative transcriptional regulator [Streptomyces sp. 2MCAF27]